MPCLLTQTSKMPGKSFSLPAGITCPTGAQLRQDSRSVCAKCYAQRGRYCQSNIKAAQLRRLEETKKPDFIDRMVAELEREARCGRPHFSWHDSGDLYSRAYTGKVMEICRRTPQIIHRLPTRELGYVRWAHIFRLVPDNLVIQAAASFVDNWAVPDAPPGCQANVIFTETPPPGAFVCPATTERKVCGDCRACWDKTIPLIAYKLH